MSSIRSFDDLRDRWLPTLRETPQRCAVAGGADGHALEAVAIAADQGFLEPVLIGAESKIQAAIEGLGRDVAGTIVDIPEGENPALKAVELIREHKADFILKGALRTADLLRPVLSKETGLNDSGFITHFGLIELGADHRLIALTDAAVIPYPKLEDKERILALGAEQLRSLGIERPVLAALCAVETVSSRMIETVEADALAKLGAEGRFGDAVVLGPISYDLAMSEESAQIKGYESTYAGKADLLLVPHMVVGNVMSKIWNSDPRNTMAGCLVGARVPVALTSRAASIEEKLTSLFLCSVLCLQKAA